MKIAYDTRGAIKCDHAAFHGESVGLKLAFSIGRDSFDRGNDGAGGAVERGGLLKARITSRHRNKT